MNAYTEEVHTVWVKVYNRMLRTIIPIAIKFEMHARKKNGSENSCSKRDFGSFVSAEYSQSNARVTTEEKLTTNNICCGEPEATERRTPLVDTNNNNNDVDDDNDEKDEIIDVAVITPPNPHTNSNQLLLHSTESRLSNSAFHST